METRDEEKNERMPLYPVADPGFLNLVPSPSPYAVHVYVR